MMCVFLFRAVQKLAIYKRWSQKWWRQRISTSSVFDTSAREKKPSTGASPLWFMRWTVEKEQFALRPDVRRWSELLSIQGLAKEKRPTFVDVRFALNWCRCAFITPSSVVKVSAKCHFAGSWNASFKLSMNIKLISRTCKGEILHCYFHNYFLTRFHFSLKPVPQFVIPPIAPMQRSSTSLSNIVSRESSSPPSEPSPKRLRLDEHSILINSGNNALRNAQPAQNTEVM